MNDSSTICGEHRGKKGRQSSSKPSSAEAMGPLKASATSSSSSADVAMEDGGDSPDAAAIGKLSITHDQPHDHDLPVNASAPSRSSADAAMEDGGDSPDAAAIGKLSITHDQPHDHDLGYQDGGDQDGGGDVAYDYGGDGNEGTIIIPHHNNITINGVAYNGDHNLELEQCKTSLKTTEHELEQCKTSLKTTEHELEQCKTSLKTTEHKLERCKLSLEQVQEDYRDRGSYIDELEEKIESLVAAVPDVSDLVTEGPELEARMNADRADRDASEKLKYETRQAHVNRVTFLYIFIIIKLIICRYCPILLTWSL
jgi:hypothetical protein